MVRRRLRRGDLRRAGELFRCVRRIRSWPSLTRAFATGVVPDQGLPVETRRGSTMRAHGLPDATTIWACFCGNDYRVRPDSLLIVDLGANIGAFSIAAAEAAPDARILAVEPVAPTRSRLRQHLADNGIDARVHVRDYAVAGAEGSGHMVQGGGWGNASMRLASAAEEPGAGDAVRCITLDEALRDALSATGLDAIDLLKMDIEGAEHDLFRDGPSCPTLARVRSIQLEYHRTGSKAALFGRLADRGFRCVFDEPRGTNLGVAHFDRAMGGPAHV